MLLSPFRMSRTILPVIALGFFASTIALSGAIREGTLTARSDGSNITIQWVSDDESGVIRYEIERKSGTNGQFLFLVQLPVKGDNASYLYVDDTAFLRAMESVYQYRIKVDYSNGTSVYYGPVTVLHQVSSVRRTWGSIKAMFR